MVAGSSLGRRNVTEDFRAVVVSASADIANALIMNWRSRNWDVCGTYRQESSIVDLQRENGVTLYQCDLEIASEIDNVSERIVETFARWDVLVLAAGTQVPVGHFSAVDIDDWCMSIQTNFLGQVRFVHRLMTHRNLETDRSPTVIFFAGAGTNNAPTNYSAYVVSKIASIKMTEVLAAEFPDTRFVIVGPGWVKTKIHQATLSAEHAAGDNYERTVQKLESNDCTSMNDVVDCCNWLIGSDRDAVTGRNFSVVFDDWGHETLLEELVADNDMYKLRRFGNKN